MDPVTLFVVLGILGGLVVAFLIFKLQRPAELYVPIDPFHDVPRTDLINMARIRVAGPGGLGIVAMCGVVALGVPQVGMSVAAGLLLGVSFAAIIILRRRRTGLWTA